MTDLARGQATFSLRSASGLSAEINANGSLRRLDHGAISLSLFVGNELEGGPTNLYLRRLTGEPQWLALLGPASPTRLRIDPASGGLVGTGTWQGIRYTLALELEPRAPLWLWRVTLENLNPASEHLDLTYAQDLALAPYGAVRMNEYYVSQYIDHTPLHHPQHGWLVASRQNQSADGRFPWCLCGSLGEATSFATDALQFYGLSRRHDAPPAGLLAPLPAVRLQHEHSMVVIRDRSLHLEAGGKSHAGFFGYFVADHPEASAPADLARLAHLGALALRAAPEAAAPAAGDTSAATLFSAAPPLRARDLDATQLRQQFRQPWRHRERDAHGKLQSFFCGAGRHVVLRAKELVVLRPHGHLLRTGLHLTPDESALTSTVWMSGIFHSMVTQGHVAINRFLSSARSYLGLYRSQGLRVFVELGGAWQLLDLPSAFEMAAVECRWLYRHADGLIEVRAGACSEPQQLTLEVNILEGAAARCLFTHHIALDGDDGATRGRVGWERDDGDILVRAAPGSEVGRRFPEGRFRIRARSGTSFVAVGGDELLFVDGRSRGEPFICAISGASRSAGLLLRGELGIEPAPAPLRVATGRKLVPSIAMSVPRSTRGHRARQLAEIAPWFAHNALVHYLSPRGLEQFSGGGWGTRDVCQGPVELLHALASPGALRDLLLRVMRAQGADGDWPQWFMFFERERAIRAGDSHGDVVFWPVLALAQYLLLTGDGEVLAERVPFAAGNGEPGEEASVWEHVQRALALIGRRIIPGTALAAYGHGDWNDSLQPADPAMRERLCSAWTVTLDFQTATTLARALRSVGRDQDAAPLEQRAAAIRRDFQRLLVVDGVLTGYALFAQEGDVRYLLHPRDHATGVHYSSLAMIHALLEDLFEPQQVRDHLRLIGEHLHAADGARLFDRPMGYHGGTQRLFQRAETAAFFGREIGLMYTHAHLRYAQALAHLGDAEQFFDALCRANPIGIRELVPAAAARQANCYYSSSDAAFTDRYQASAEYERIARGTISLEGGWRVYSSGAGIFVGLMFRHFLGFRREAADLLIDPVIPSALDGLKVRIELLGRAFDVRYRIGAAGCGVVGVTVNGRALTISRAANPHRAGAARLAVAMVLEVLRRQGNTMEISLG